MVGRHSIEPTILGAHEIVAPMVPRMVTPLAWRPDNLEEVVAVAGSIWRSVAVARGAMVDRRLRDDYEMLA
jgi:hypothetical protein